MFSERKLSSLLSFSKNTVSKSLSELEDRGLITCYPRKGNGLMANEEDSLKRPERGSRKDSLTANVKGKGAFSSTFWFPEVQLRKAASSAPKGVQGKTGSQQMRKTTSQQMRKTASRQMREEKKDVYNKGVRYNVHRAENSLTANKGGSKYAKFF
jgi:DNA-binding transcriptional MocR family regulator